MAPATDKGPSGTRKDNRSPNTIKKRKLKMQACSMKELHENMRDVDLNKNAPGYIPPSRTRLDWYWKRPEVVAKRSARLLNNEKTEEKRKKKPMAAAKTQGHKVAEDTHEDEESELSVDEDTELAVDGDDEVDRDPRGPFPTGRVQRDPRGRFTTGPRYLEDSNETLHRVMSLLGMIADRGERQKAEEKAAELCDAMDAMNITD